MLDYDQAKERAQQFINEKYVLKNDEIIILDENSDETASFWVFHYDSRKYLETGNPLFMMQVEFPVLVNKEDGSCELKRRIPMLHGF